MCALGLYSLIFLSSRCWDLFAGVTSLDASLCFSPHVVAHVSSVFDSAALVFAAGAANSPQCGGVTVSVASRGPSIGGNDPIRLATLTLALAPNTDVRGINVTVDVSQITYASGMQTRSPRAVAVGRNGEAVLHVHGPYAALVTTLPRGSTLINTAVLDGAVASLPIVLHGVERNGRMVPIATPDRCSTGDDEVRRFAHLHLLCASVSPLLVAR